MQKGLVMRCITLCNQKNMESKCFISCVPDVTLEKITAEETEKSGLTTNSNHLNQFEFKLNKETQMLL